jgi:hypothetical protein
MACRTNLKIYYKYTQPTLQKGARTQLSSAVYYPMTDHNLYVPVSVVSCAIKSNGIISRSK